jgi:hypothetical protein
MPHTPTASEIDRMPTPPPRNPGLPPPRQHPGDPFVPFKPFNSCHYPLQIQLPDGDTVEARYIAYYQEVENPYMTGTMGYGHPIYGAPLMAREDMTGPPDEDSAHVSFELMHIFYGQINEAIQSIRDPGLTADVARYRWIAKRRAELQMQERDLDRRWADMVQDLTQITRRQRNAPAWQRIRPLILSNQEHPLLVRRGWSNSTTSSHLAGPAFRLYHHREEAGQHHMPRQLTPAQRVNLGTTNNDHQHCLCHLCQKKGHRAKWCWTPHKWCPEDCCRVKSTHAYYAHGPLCKTAAYNIGEPLSEDKDNDSFNIEERPKD